MKNLKQVLALGMAFSLTMSTMAGAAFTDSADIKATEAVDMLSSLGVIKGYEDGSFKPEGTVTRAEAAKMIFTIRNGGNDNADAFKNAPTTFTDLNGYGWAEGYIKYCQANGIIAGKSATSFDPGAKVTGVELAKMMLVSLGYNASKAGLTGATWSTNTLSLASENGLLTSVNSDLAAGLPRQYAAQLIYNAVMAPTVRWSDDRGTYTNVDALTGNKYATLGNTYMNLDVYEGILKTDSDYDMMGTAAGKNTVVIDSKYKNGNVVSGDVSLKYEGDASGLVGEYVKVLYNNIDKKSYGVYSVANENHVVETTLGKIDAVTASANKIKVDGTEYDLAGRADSLTVYQNGTDVFFDAYLTGTKSATKVKLVSNNGDEKFDMAVVTPVNLYKVAYVGSDNITFQAVNGSIETVPAIGNVKKADCVINGELAKDDYVAIVNEAYNKDSKYEVTKVDIVEAKVEEVKKSGSSTTDIKVNGEWHTLLKTTTGGLKDDAGVELAVDNTYKLAMIDGYVYNAEKVTGSSTKLGLITGVTNNTDFDGYVQARMILTDGTEVTAYMKEVEAVGSLTTGDIDKLVAYEKDGERYKLYFVGKTYTNSTNTTKAMAGYNTAVGISNGVVNGSNSADSSAFDKDNDTVANTKINNTAVVFVQSKDTNGNKKYSVISGKDLNAWNADWGNAGGGLYKTSGMGYLDVAVVKNNANTPVPGSSSNYAYVVSDISEGTDYVSYQIWDGTSESAVTVTEKVTSTAATKGAVIKFEWDGEGVVKNVVSAGATSGIIKYTNGTQVKIGTSTNDEVGTGYDLADDVKIINIDNANKSGIAGNIITEGAKDSSGNYVGDNAWYKLNGDGKIELLVIDTKNGKL